MAALSPTPYWRGTVDRTLTDHSDQLGDHEDRIRPLEKFMWKILGAAVIGSLLGGCLTTVLAYTILGALGQH